jgi:hypothetical protein
MPGTPIPWPAKGISDNLAFGEQEPESSRASQNVRSLDPQNGRLRGGQRAGHSKFQPVGTVGDLTGSGDGVKLVASMQLPARQVDYATLATPGDGGDEMYAEHSTRVPSGGQPYDIKTDAVGNLFALDGNVGLVKFSADLKVIWTVACPQADGDHVNRALILDEFGAAYLAVTEGGDHAKSRIWCVEPDPEFLNTRSGGKEQDKGRLRWQLQMNEEDERIDKPNGYGHIGGMKVRDGFLYTVQNDPDQRRSWIVVYADIDTANPRRRTSWEVPYPAHEIVTYESGATAITCPVEANRGENPKYPQTHQPALSGIWHPEHDLDDYESRIWCWLSCNEMMPDGSDPLDTYEDPTTGETKVLRWRDRSGKGRHLYRHSSDDPPVVARDWAGKRCLEFRGAESLVSLANGVVEKAYADSQKTVLPGYTDASFCVVMVVQMERGDTDQHVWLWQNNDNAAKDGEWAIVANRREDGDGNARRPGLVSVFDVTDSTSGHGPNSNEPMHACFDRDCTGAVDQSGGAGETERVPVGGIVTVFNNGGLSGAPDSFFRFNGCPFDQWTSTAFDSTATDTTVVGRNDTGTTNWGYAHGRLYEIFVLDRKDRSDDTAGCVEAPDLPIGTTSGTGLAVGFIEIEAGGTGWTEGTGSFTCSGGTAGTNCSGTWYADGGDVIRRLTITEPGDGYTTQPSSISVTGSGSGETLTAYLYDPASETEIEQIEGYFAHTYGIQHVLDDDGYDRYVLFGSGLTTSALNGIGQSENPTHGSNSAFTHPYYSTAPYPTGGVDLTDLNSQTKALVVKYGADEDRPVKWILTKTGADVKYGWGLQLQERDDDLINTSLTYTAILHTAGPDGYDSIQDKGDSASDSTPTGASASEDNANEYVRMDTALSRHTFIPWLPDDVNASPQSVLFVIGGSKEFWLSDTTAANNQGAYAVAVPKDIPYFYESENKQKRTFYEGDVAASEAAPLHMFVALCSDDDGQRVDGSGDSDLYTIVKVKLVSETPNGNPARKSVFLGVADTGDFYRLRRGTAWSTEDTDWGAPDNGSVTMTTQAAAYYSGVVLNGQFFVCDGGGSASASRTGGIYVYTPHDPVVANIEEHVALQARFGKVPESPRLLSAWRGRLVATRGTNWFMSASGDPRDWDFYPPVITPSSAITDQLTNTGPGVVPDTINAFIPYDNDTAIFGCDHHIYLLRGDPRDNGQIDLIAGGDDRNAPIGMSFGPCWAKNRQGLVYFTDNNGSLYVMSPDGAIRDLSEERIGRRLRDVDLESYFFALAYSYDEKGIRIYQVPYDLAGDSASLKSWIFEERTGSFQEDVLGNSDHKVGCVAVFDADSPDDRALVVGCADGYVRQVDRDADTDDGTAIDSYQTFGPLQFAPRGYYTRLISAHVHLADDYSGAARFEVFGTNKAERFPDSPQRSRELPRGLATVDAGVAARYPYIRLRNAQTTSWAFESMEVEGYAGGKLGNA